ncbi:E3 ubiquitin-protein ligase MYLIP [Hetaerina americana]|uniref:E3 ubiquitin-protein ligase MYLIP n=1 Tax=Hetaerina americana TaxID=62018 RepID=UPI003A7F37EC
MWCIVSQPNSVILEVEVDPKSKGQECLEKVCQFLGISKEEDYFGLKFHVSSKGNGISREAWLNLRNQIGRQMVGLPPFRLALRVKFWVPPHLLLQEATRHQFYLHARRDLSEGRLKVDGPIAVKMVALVAQGELGDLEADAGSTPAGLPASPPFDLYSCLVPSNDPEKFLSPDFLAQVATEHRKLKGMKRSAAEYWLLKEISKLEHFGEEEYKSHRVQDGIPVTVGVGPHGLSLYDAEGVVTQRIPYTAITSASSRRRLFYLGYISSLSPSSATTPSTSSSSIGTQRNSMSTSGDNSQPTQASSQTLEQEQRVAGAARGPTEASLCLKMDSVQSASCLYRCTTEKHAFYSCETVRSAVTSQFVRDLKGTIASIFNEDTSLGKKYVFDIRRTCREVYDNARRALYQSKSNPITSSCSQSSSSSPSSASENMDPLASFPFPEFSSDLQSPNCLSPFASEWDLSSSQQVDRKSCKDCDSKKCKEQKEQLTRIMEAMSCRICMDRPTNTAFFPCGHVICCEDCARRCLPMCPVCRAPVTSSKQVFLPVPLSLAVASTTPASNSISHSP